MLASTRHWLPSAARFASARRSLQSAHRSAMAASEHLQSFSTLGTSVRQSSMSGAYRTYKGLIILSDGSTVSARFNSPGRIVMTVEDIKNSPPFVDKQDTSVDDEYSKHMKKNLGLGSAGSVGFTEGLKKRLKKKKAAGALEGN